MGRKAERNFVAVVKQGREHTAIEIFHDGKTGKKQTRKGPFEAAGALRDKGVAFSTRTRPSENLVWIETWAANQPAKIVALYEAR